MGRAACHRYGITVPWCDIVQCRYLAVERGTSDQHVWHVFLFNCDITKWDVPRVTDMSSMFSRTTSFNADIMKWNVARVTNMHEMFFTQHLSNMNFPRLFGFTCNITRYDIYCAIASCSYIKASSQVPFANVSSCRQQEVALMALKVQWKSGTCQR